MRTIARKILSRSAGSVTGVTPLSSMPPGASCATTAAASPLAMAAMYAATAGWISESGVGSCSGSAGQMARRPLRSPWMSRSEWYMRTDGAPSSAVSTIANGSGNSRSPSARTVRISVTAPVSVSTALWTRVSTSR